MSVTNATNAGSHKIIGYSAESDLCVLDAEGVTGPPLKLSQTQESPKTYVIGHPRLGPLTTFSGPILDIQPVSLSYGDMFGRSDPFMVAPRPFDDMVSSSYVVRSLILAIPGLVGGTSGSPVVNESGEVLGVLYACSPEDGVAVTLGQLREFLDFIATQLSQQQQG